MPTYNLGKEIACIISKFAADSILVGTWGSGGRQSIEWRAGQPFGWASIGCQKHHEAIKSAKSWDSATQVLQNPGAGARLAEEKLCRKGLSGPSGRKWNTYMY